jgi:hypothetical protein
MGYTNFIRLQDLSAESPLWSVGGIGEEVYVLATSIDINGQNIVNPTNKTFQDISAATDATYVDNFNRRKANLSYGGFINQKINLTAVYSDSKIGNTATIGGTERKIFTPSKLYELILKPRTVYLKDEFLITLLSQEQDTSPAIYSTNGIPVLLTDYTITPSLNEQEVTMKMSFIEDKEIE